MDALFNFFYLSVSLQKSEQVKFFTDQVRPALGSVGWSVETMLRITYISAYMPHDSSENPSKQPDVPLDPLDAPLDRPEHP